MKPNTPLVSIIIPCYNDVLYIEQAVNSALNQTYKNKEVIVVDDGSNVETKSVLETLKPRLTELIIQENKGQSTARNVGIKNAKGDFIIVLDSDDFFEPTFCEKAIKYIQNDDTIKIVSCYTNLLYDYKPIELYKPRGGSIDKFMFTSGVLGSSLIRKKDWKQANGYDESMRNGFEDWEFYIRLLKDGGKAIIVEEPLFNYRRRECSTTARANQNKYDLLAYIFNKHKALYKENHEEVVSYLLYLANTSKKDEIKRMHSIDYKLGHFLLKPFRYCNQLFFKIFVSNDDV